MATKPNDKPTPPPQPEVQIPAAPGGKQETRLFQTHPGEKRWLTKAEAEKAGHYWRED